MGSKKLVQIHPLEYQGPEGTVTLDKTDSRLYAGKPPSFETSANDELWPTLQENLNQVDITHGLEPWAIIKDEREKPDEEEELVIMNKIDGWLNQIIQDGNDIHHRIDANLREWVKYLILLCFRQRKIYGIGYPDESIQLDTRELWWTDHQHWDHARKSGEPYSRTHLFGAEENLITLTGLVGIMSRLIVRRHDDGEDLEVHHDEEGNPDPQNELFICDPYSHEYKFDPKALADRVVWLTEKLYKLKVKKMDGSDERDRKLESAKAIIKILQTILEDIGGILLVAVKGSERAHNQATIMTNTPESRERITHETATVYAPLARTLKFYKLYDKLFTLCFRYAENKRPSAIPFYNRNKEQRAERFQDPTSELNARLKNVSQNPDITYMGIHPRLFSDYAKFEELKTRDYRPSINPKDPMHEIVIFVDDPQKIRTVEQDIIPKICDDDAEYEANLDPRGGRKIEIEHRTLGGRVNIWITDEKNQALLKRGERKLGQKEISMRVKAGIMALLDSTKHNPVSILHKMEKGVELTDGLIQVHTPDGKSIWLPSGATATDALCSLHSDTLKRCYKIVVNPTKRTDSPTNNDPAHMRLTNGCEILVITEPPRRTSQVLTDLTWQYWVYSAENKARLKKHFHRGKKADKERRAKKHINDLNKLFGLGNDFKEIKEMTIIMLYTASLDRRFTPEQQRKMDELLRKIMRAKRAKHAYKPSKIPKPKREKAQERYKNLQRESQKAQNAILKMIGEAEINPLELLAEHINLGKTGIRFAVNIAHDPSGDQKIAKIIADDGHNVAEKSGGGKSRKQGVMYYTIYPNNPKVKGYRADLPVTTEYDIFRTIVKIKETNNVEIVGEENPLKEAKEKALQSIRDKYITPHLKGSKQNLTDTAAALAAVGLGDSIPPPPLPK